MKATDLFVRALEAEGVKYIFGVPGEENLDFMESLRTSSIRFIVTRHEQAAVIMASTMGRLTGKAGVALATLGPGATNMVTGVAYAQLGGMPLVVITGQKPIRKSKQGRFQIIDVVRMMEPITKMSTTIVSADRLPATVHEAFRCAQRERPGAVHIELPEDVAAEHTDAAVISPVKMRRAGPDPKAIAQAIDCIQKSQRPLILIASGANRKLIRKHLEAFVIKTGIPFVTTQMGKGVLDETRDDYLGTTALSANDYVHCALERADTLIVIGHDVTEKPPALLNDGRTVIHINFSEAIIDDVYAPTMEVIGDIAHTLWAMTENITPSSTWDFSSYKTFHTTFLSHIQEKSDSDAYPIKPQRIVRALRECLPSDGILALDNGMYKLWVARNFPAIEQNTVLLDNALATMGAGLPSAMAAKLLYPDRPVIALVGDGGFLMSAQELETAKRLNLNLTVLIVRDDAYGMIAWKQQGMGFEPFGLSFDNPDFVRFAESFGLDGIAVQSAAHLDEVLRESISKPGIHIIDCPIDYSENIAVFDEELSKKTCDI